MFLLDLMHFAKQQHREVFKFSKLLQDDFQVQKGHMLDVVSQHVGTTSEPCSIGQIDFGTNFLLMIQLDFISFI